MTSSDSKPNNIWRRRCAIVVVAWLVSIVLMSLSSVRALVATPLYAHDANAQGEVAYVMADGPAYWERLRAASDLYHWKKIKRIIILNETGSAGYNFVRQQSDTRYQKAIDYLELYGVPEDKVLTIEPQPNAFFGSLSEAQAVAKTFPEIKSIVVVTSAPHTRRSLICFQRSCQSDVAISCLTRPPN